MRIFLAGATGAIGRRLTPLLIQAGHQVSAMTRSPEKLASLQAQGAEPVLADALSREQLQAALLEASPEAVIDLLTALPPNLDTRRLKRELAVTDRLRSDGTKDLVAAARRAGATRVIAESVAFAYMQLSQYPGRETLRTEQDPLDHEAAGHFKRSVEALQSLEQEVRSADGVEGIVLRYGYLYGPGTAFSTQGALVAELRRRRLPLVGSGSGVWSFLHVDDAAAATLAALQGPPGVYNIVDDDPAPVSEWLPALADAVGAPTPRRIPTALARVIGGSYTVRAMTATDGASNARAKQELRWSPQIASWRQGFRTVLG
ncbi:MAG TPA: NAD(P)-dependent oxidoreductase [Solirubrobacteraceae bacterium]|jgi:nucleoside-diphosphate-sugar epimerase